MSEYRVHSIQAHTADPDSDCNYTTRTRNKGELCIITQSSKLSGIMLLSRLGISRLVVGNLTRTPALGIPPTLRPRGLITKGLSRHILPGRCCLQLGSALIVKRLLHSLLYFCFSFLRVFYLYFLFIHVFLCLFIFRYFSTLLF